MIQLDEFKASIITTPCRSGYTIRLTEKQGLPLKLVELDSGAEQYSTGRESVSVAVLSQPDRAPPAPLTFIIH